MKLDIKNLQPLGLAHFTVIDVAPIELVDIARQIGYTSIGLRLFPAFPGAPFYEIPVGSQAMRDMKTRLKATGITIYDIEFVVLNETFDQTSLSKILESAAELGARRLSVCGDIADHIVMTAKYAALCQFASQFNMCVDLEIMKWRQVSTLQKALRVVEDAQQSNSGILIDALHLVRSGAMPKDLSVVPKHFIRSVQLCDAHAKIPVTTEDTIREARSGRLVPGEGVLPLAELLRAIPQDANLAVEVPNTGDHPVDHAKLVYKATRKYLTVCASRYP